MSASTTPRTVGELITRLHPVLKRIWGDEELANVALATVVDELLWSEAQPGPTHTAPATTTCRSQPAKRRLA